MTAEIQVDQKSEGEFAVTVSEGGSRSTHTVTLAGDYYEKLTGGAIPARELIQKSFEFLLAREPKESILSRFDLTVIAQYFPEYERKIKKRVSR